MRALEVLEVVESVGRKKGRRREKGRREKGRRDKGRREKEKTMRERIVERKRIEKGRRRKNGERIVAPGPWRRAREVLAQSLRPKPISAVTGRDRFWSKALRPPPLSPPPLPLAPPSSLPSLFPRAVAASSAVMS